MSCACLLGEGAIPDRRRLEAEDGADRRGDVRERRARHLGDAARPPARGRVVLAQFVEV